MNFKNLVYIRRKIDFIECSRIRRLTTMSAIRTRFDRQRPIENSSNMMSRLIVMRLVEEKH